MPAHAALTELARLLGRRAASRHRQGLGLSEAALAPALLLVAIAIAAILFGLHIMGAL
jgi:hypothetical protein